MRSTKNERGSRRSISRVKQGVKQMKDWKRGQYHEYTYPAHYSCSAHFDFSYSQPGRGYSAYCQQLDLSRAHSITMPRTCINNTSCNKPKVVPEPEIHTPRGKERQCGVCDIWAAGSMGYSTWGQHGPVVIADSFHADGLGLITCADRKEMIVSPHYQAG